MLAWLGQVAEAVSTVFKWVTNPQGLEETRKKWAGERLKAAADDAFLEWVQVSTEENWKAYQDAKAALVRHSHTP